MEEEHKVERVMPAQMLDGLQGPISSVQGVLAVTNHITTCSLTLPFTSLNGPLENVNDFVRFHVVVRGISTSRTHIAGLPICWPFMVNEDPVIGTSGAIAITI
jgi:hypothetical protein